MVANVVAIGVGVCPKNKKVTIICSYQKNDISLHTDSKIGIVIVVPNNQEVKQ